MQELPRCPMHHHDTLCVRFRHCFSALLHQAAPECITTTARSPLLSTGWSLVRIRPGEPTPVHFCSPLSTAVEKTFDHQGFRLRVVHGCACTQPHSVPGTTFLTIEA